MNMRKHVVNHILKQSQINDSLYLYPMHFMHFGFQNFPFFYVIRVFIKLWQHTESISKIMHIFFTNIFISLRLYVHNPSVQSPCFSMTESQRLGSIIIASKTPLLFICRIAQVPSVEISSREEKRSPPIGSFNFGNKSKSDDSCLDCRTHVLILPTHNREDFFLLKHLRCAGEYCHGE